MDEDAPPRVRDPSDPRPLMPPPEPREHHLGYVLLALIVMLVAWWGYG